MAEAHRKSRKEAKKNPKKKIRKDPGIPNLFPFKEKLIAQALAKVIFFSLKNRRRKTVFLKKKG